MPDFVETQKKSMNPSPKDEVKRCSMPKTTQKHRHEKVEILAELAMTIATKRNIEIIFEPRGKADVPTAPKLCDRGGFVGAIEVFGKMESKQERYTDSHIGIA